MLLDDTEVTERMNSPLNLLNRLKSISRSHNKNSIDNIIPTLPPDAKDIIDNLEDKLAYGSIKTKAAGIMVAAMDELKAKLPEVQKPEQLARIAESMSKVVNAETKDNSDRLHAPQFVLYAPEFHNENHYETIYARE